MIVEIVCTLDLSRVVAYVSDHPAWVIQRIYQIETISGMCMDVYAPDRAAALAWMTKFFPHEVVIDSKDKTAKRHYERAKRPGQNADD